jgi:hypothetical protein
LHCPFLNFFPPGQSHFYAVLMMPLSLCFVVYAVRTYLWRSDKINTRDVERYVAVLLYSHAALSPWDIYIFLLAYCTYVIQVGRSLRPAHPHVSIDPRDAGAVLFQGKKPMIFLTFVPS